jgi:hypothetical protein
MPKRIGIIKAAIGVEGIGTIIGLPDSSEWTLGPNEAVYRRERIQIRTPEGKCLSTHIKELTVMHGLEHPGRTCFITPDFLLAVDVTPGSELWLERDEGAEPVLEPWGRKT